jgi:uncharacterized radical SAM superfamily Fe-S cluster-containing enzyme
MTHIEPTNFDSRLDEILLTLVKDMRGLDYDRVNLLISSGKEAELRAMVHQTANNGIKELFLEIIGEDDERIIDTTSDIHAYFITAKHQLRQQLRNTVGGKK